MARKYILLAAIGTLTITAVSPAFALNPQPLPPGRVHTPTISASTPLSQQCANGKHFQTVSLSIRKAGGSN